MIGAHPARGSGKGVGVALTALSAALALVLVETPQVGAPPILLNTSSSLPRGIYLRASRPPELGSVVAVAAPIRAQGYLATLGAPADALLLKRVAATGGHHVCSHGRRLTVGPRQVDVLVHDRRGAVLPRWRQCRSLAADEVLLLGDSPMSFDGRYFGPVRLTDLKGVYRKLRP